MKNNLLLQILQNFSPGQIKSWAVYCQSPFHITNTNLQRLSELMLKHTDQEGFQLLDKPGIWQQLHPDRPYQASAMNNYFSDLLQATYAFLAHHKLQQNEDTAFALQCRLCWI